MSEIKKFEEMHNGEYLFCADTFGRFHASKIYSVSVGNKVVTIKHAYNNNAQRFPLGESCMECDGLKRYVATSKDELAQLMSNGVKDYNEQIRLLKSRLDDFVNNRYKLIGMSDDEVINGEKLFND